MTDNWTENRAKTLWKHKDNKNVIVRIIRNTLSDSPKYFVYHSHPAPGGRSVIQEPEGAMTMGSARKKADRHLKHWGNSNIWIEDSDYNRVGQRGK